MQIRTAQFGIGTQFFLSYCIVGVVSTLISMLLVNMHTQLLISLVVAGAIGGAIGLLVTWNIQRGFAHLEHALTCFAQNRPLANEEQSLYWPLTMLFVSLQQCNQRVIAQVRQEQMASEQREQLLRSVGEAAVQDERNRLARELHDSIKQQMFGIDMSAAAMATRLGNGLETIREPLADIQHSVQEAQIEMDALLQQLRPASLTIAGLVEAMRTQCEVLGYRTNAQVAVEVHDLPSDELLPPGTTDALFRIVQEALANIARHARAHTVTVRMYKKDDALHIEIHDDGQGFDTSAASTGMGLANIRERTQALSGSVDIQSRQGDTTLALRIPLLRQPLLTPEVSRELAIYTTKVQVSHDIVGLAVQASALCILLTVPFIVILLGLCIAFNWFRIAYQERIRASRISGGISSHMLGLQSKERELLAGILIMAGLCVWYLPVLLPHQILFIAIGLPLGVSSLCGVLALIVYVGYYRITSRYYRHLLPEERESQVRQQQNMAVTGLCVWLFVIMIALLIGQFDLALFPHTLAQWSDDTSLVLLILWPIVDITNYVWNRRWKHIEIRRSHD